jgi:DNA-binding beta-propeller fold protein YncE
MPRRSTAAALAAFALCALSAPASAQPPVPALPGSCLLDGIDDRCESWSRAYDADPGAQGLSSEAASAHALSPDGRHAYVTVTHRVGGQYGVTRWVLLALDATTGATRWTSRFEGTHDYDRPGAVAISPDGKTVFVTGTTHLPGGASVMLTMAHAAADGRELWRTVHDGPGELDNGRAMVVSPDGTEIYVAASSETAPGQANDLDFLVAGYDAASGRELFATRWGGAGTGGVDYPMVLATHPDGRLVYAAGQAAGTAKQWDIDAAAIAVQVGGRGRGRNRPGAIAWAKRWDARGLGENDEAYDATVSPDGEHLYLAGRSRGTGPSAADYDAATLALDAATGAERWSALQPGQIDGYTSAHGVAAAGGRVFTTTQTPGSAALEFDWLTIAYDGADGSELWRRTFSTPRADGEYPADVAATGDGVWVTGKSFNGSTNPLGRNGDIQGLADIVTASYHPVTGEDRWIARYNATGYGHDSSSAIAAAGGRVLGVGMVRYKGDLSKIGEGNPYGRENYSDVGLFAYEDAAAR